MAKTKFLEKQENRTELSVRPHYRGEMIAYQEQQCPACNQYAAQFSRGRVFDPQFDRCRACRGVEQAS